MTYTPVSHTLGFTLSGGAVDSDFPEFLPTTNTAFITPTFTLQENPVGPGVPTNFLITDFAFGSLIGPATSGFPTGRPSFGQLYPR